MADSAKTVAIDLLNQRVFHDTGEVRLRFPDGSSMPRPVLCFALDDVGIEAVVLDLADKSRPPLDPVSGRPDRGLTVDEVRELVAAQPRVEIGT
jgi:hypothetical protein